LLPPGAIFKLKIHQNGYAAGASPRPHWGKLQSSPDSLAGFQGVASRQGRGKGEEKEEKEEKGGDSVPNYNLTTAQQCIVAATYTRSLDLALQLVCSSVYCQFADWLWIFV